ncbi:MAG TPA: sigma 54-interacting transcriptional regulator [Gemmataceae bacterium]|nr:sigma 54-interacting transcriptional regulator [Gemmataceae bacterium]
MGDSSLVLPATDDLAAASGRVALAQRLLVATPSLQPLVGPLVLAACHELPVFIRGLPGTGRSYLAHVLHLCSSRYDQPFVLLACADLPASVLERALFGTVGSEAAREGGLRVAGAGTLVLEDVEALSTDHQARLLRVLETGEFEQAGDTQTHLGSARIITASADLEGAAACGLFRRDLCYRLAGVTFYLPPLRERPDDIAPLARAFTLGSAKQFGKNIAALESDTVAVLQAYSWPGNVRQLSSVIQQAVLAASGSVLLPQDLPRSIFQRVNQAAAMRCRVRTARRGPATDEHERLLIQSALDTCANNRSQAARTLGISRVTLYKKMRKYFLLSAPPSFGTSNS